VSILWQKKEPDPNAKMSENLVEKSAILDLFIYLLSGLGGPGRTMYRGDRQRWQRCRPDYSQKMLKNTRKSTDLTFEDLVRRLNIFRLGFFSCISLQHVTEGYSPIFHATYHCSPVSRPRASDSEYRQIHAGVFLYLEQQIVKFSQQR
jgi:hypothetical protein